MRSQCDSSNLTLGNWMADNPTSLGSDGQILKPRGQAWSEDPFPCGILNF